GERALHEEEVDVHRGRAPRNGYGKRAVDAGEHEAMATVVGLQRRPVEAKKIGSVARTPPRPEPGGTPGPQEPTEVPLRECLAPVDLDVPNPERRPELRGSLCGRRLARKRGGEQQRGEPESRVGPAAHRGIAPRQSGGISVRPRKEPCRRARCGSAGG